MFNLKKIENGRMNVPEPYFLEANKLGITQAATVLKELLVNRNIYKMSNYK